MKERPILFSAPMVRALLAGTKTQTRRVVKPEPTHFNPAGVPRRAKPEGPSTVITCPYGQPGDRLWVRETHAINPHPSELGLTRDMIPGTWDSAVAAAGRVIYAADPGAEIELDGRQWRPSIHMPRAASRITLEITGVRVERLQDISEADAVAEGCQPQCEHDEDRRHQYTARWAYEVLWDRINGRSSWGANPWVWVVEFKREEGRAA